MLHNINLDQLEHIKGQNPETCQLIDDLFSNHKMIISTITHEIRNPLAMIYCSLQLIQSAHPEVKHFDHWKDTLSDVEYMAILLDDLTTINKGYQPRKENVNFQDLLRHTAIDFANSIANSSVEFTSQIDDSLSDIIGDRVKLQELLQNILQNAFDAVDETGKISLHAIQKDKDAIITISDNGCGISDEQLNQIFKPFQSFKKEGSGLGLAIAKQVIERHQGKINIESEVGVGTTFTIILPTSMVEQDSTEKS